MKKSLLIYCLLFIGFGCNSQSPKPDTIEAFAEEVEVVFLFDLMYETRFGHITTPKIVKEPFFTFLEWADTISFQETQNWIEDENPTIRALGIINLYRFNRQESISTYARFLSDSSICFKENPYRPLGCRPPPPPPPPIITDELLEKINARIRKKVDAAKGMTVSHVAQTIIKHHFSFSERHHSEDNFTTYLNSQKGLKYSASFLKLLKAKAVGWVNYLPKEHKSLALKFKENLEIRVDSEDKPLYKIYLSTSGYQLYSEQELIQQLQLLGREKVLAILRREPPTEDPDLLQIQKGKFRDPHYKGMCRWILLHADKVLKQEDVDFLLERNHFEESESWRSEFGFQYWHIACSQLDKDNAFDYLQKGLEKYVREDYNHERMELYLAVWRNCGFEKTGFILDWIYSDCELNKRMTEKIPYFIDSLKQKKDIKLIEAIVKDKRFVSSLSVQSIINLAKQINEIEEKMVTSTNLYLNIKHPVNLYYLENIWNEALAKYPQETEHILKVKKTLQQELRLFFEK